MVMSSSAPLGHHSAFGPVTFRLAAAVVVLAGATGAWAWLELRAPDAGGRPAAAPSAAQPPPAATIAAAAVPTPPPAYVHPAPAEPNRAMSPVAPAPAAPGHPAPAAPATGRGAPSFDIVRVNPQGEAVIAGRSQPGAQVVIADNGKPIAKATADAHGEWVALPAAPLQAGGQQLTLSATPPGKPGAAAASPAPVIVMVPPQVPPGPGQSTGALAVLTPPSGPAQILQLPELPHAPGEAAGAAGPPRLGLGVVDYDAQGAIRFAGTAPPDSTVRVYIDRRAAGDAVADMHGRWTLQPASGVAQGHHQLRLDQLGAGARVAARVALPFDRVQVPPQAVAGGKVVVQPGQCLWRIARSAYGQGIRYTVIYLANRSEIRDPNLIYPGQIFSIPASAAGPDPASSSTSR